MQAGNKECQTCVLSTECKHASQNTLLYKLNKQSYYLKSWQFNMPQGSLKILTHKPKWNKCYNSFKMKKWFFLKIFIQAVSV